MTHHVPAEFVAAVDEQLARAGFGPSDTYRPAPPVFADQHVVDVTDTVEPEVVHVPVLVHA